MYSYLSAIVYPDSTLREYHDTPKVGHKSLQCGSVGFLKATQVDSRSLSGFLADRSIAGMISIPASKLNLYQLIQRRFFFKKKKKKASANKTGRKVFLMVNFKDAPQPLVCINFET
jgi:hypothetical protein